MLSEISEIMNEDKKVTYCIAEEDRRKKEKS